MLKKGVLLIFLWSIIIVTGQAQARMQMFDADNSAFSYFGRTDRSDPKVVRFDWPGVYLRCAFTGNTLEIRLKGGKRDYFNVFIDDLPVKVIHPDLDSIVVVKELSGKQVHELLITKRTEADMGMASFYGIRISALGKISRSKVSNKRKIEFIGNSITCGYGAEGLSGKERFKPETENSYFSYASIAARAFSADYSLIAHS
jgi:hypothetical protein